MAVGNSAECLFQLPFLKEINMAKSKNFTISSATLISTLDGLVAERENFEKEEYARSNKRLYAILGEIYKNYLLIKQNKDGLKEAVKAMTAKLKVEGGRVQESTVVITLFVRYVFRTDRQRSFNYSRTLQAAIAKNIRPESLADFIESSGGVEECKRQFTKKDETIQKQARIQETLPLVEERLVDEEFKLSEFQVPAEWVQKTHGEELTFLVGKADKKGNMRVMSVVPAYSKGMANWAKKQLALFLIEQQEISKKHRRAKRKDNAITSAIDAAKKNNPATETVGELLSA
jgi:hypothetical protein